MALILDLETVAIPGADALVEPVSAPSNYKDPDKISAYILEKQAKQIADAGLYPYTARIIALGWCEEGEDIERVETCDSDREEAALLRDFWPRISNRRGGEIPICTFGGRRFDLPLIMIRSTLLGVEHPALDIRRYYTPHIDVLEKLTFNGEIDYRSLRWFAKRLGLNTDDAFSGKEIAQLYDDKNWDGIRAHCASDVKLTREIGERIGVLKAPVRPVVAA